MSVIDDIVYQISEDILTYNSDRENKQIERERERGGGLGRDGLYS